MTEYLARKEYTYSGGDAIFSVPFSYIKKAYINVLVNEVPIDNYTFLNSSQIRVTSALNNGDVVSIVRTTPIDERLVVFSDTSILNKDVQNLAAEQVFDVVQEIYDNNYNIGLDVLHSLQTAGEALTTANNADVKSNQAISIANTAESNSESAVTAANNAVTLANQAVNTANSANATAEDANDTANAASDKVDGFGESIETVIEAAGKINELEEAIEQCKEYAEMAGKGFGFKPISETDWSLGQDNYYYLTVQAPIVLGVYSENKELLTSVNIRMGSETSTLKSHNAFNGYVLVSAKNVESEDDNPITPEEMDSYEITDWDDI